MGVKYLLIDGNNLLCRAHFATNLTDMKGRPTSGINGVMRMSRKLVAKFAPDIVIMTWDGGKSEQRMKVYPEYKANRMDRDPAMKKAIVRQQKICQRVFGNLPVRQICVKGVEADDIIGLLCDKLKGSKLVLSNDSDFVQVVNKNTRLFIPNKKKVKGADKEGFMLTVDNVTEYLGFPVEHYVLWKSMVGDSSDNIKGIKGVGPKRATGIILNGVGGKKKLPINKEEMAILDRNKYLISLASLLTKAEAKEIKQQFQFRTIPDWNAVRDEFSKVGMKQLNFGFNNWAKPFKGLACQQ